MTSAFKCSQLKNTLTVVYSEDALLDRRNLNASCATRAPAHSRGTGTVKQTEGFSVLTSPGCPRLQKRPNINHEGSTAGDALMQVSVPTEETARCIECLDLLR